MIHNNNSSVLLYNINYVNRYVRTSFCPQGCNYLIPVVDFHVNILTALKQSLLDDRLCGICRNKTSYSAKQNNLDEQSKNVLDSKQNFGKIT